MQGTNVLYFAIGAAVGGAAVYFGLKNKMENKLNEEVNKALESIERVVNSEKEKETKKEENDIQIDNEDMLEYARMLAKERYDLTEDHSLSNDDVEDPYILNDPNKFGENENWSCQYFVYYSDGIVTDENNEIVPLPSSLLGADFEDILKKSKDGVIQVVNPMLRTYFEVAAMGAPYNDDCFDEEDDEEDDWEE